MYRMESSKVALVTGSSRGIGAQTALLFAQHGYSVVINYLNAKVQAESLKQEILAKGVQCSCLQADVSDENAVARLFTEADKLGPLAALVNNAGVLDKQSPIENIGLERFKRVFETNVLSAFLCTKAAIPRMSNKHGGNGGVIVNVSSIAAVSGAPNEYIDYACSKGAMDAMTVGTAKELAGEGIRVNAVRPALIYTDMHTLGGEPERVDRLSSNIPLGRGGQSKEVAEAIYWLASDKSSFVTGKFIDVSGGL